MKAKATARTLGVLTKPDRADDITQWAGILNGDTFRLGHGYYVIYNNPDPAVGLQEDKFFCTRPWTSELASFKNRFGTPNLKRELSLLLIGQIEKDIGDLIRERALRVRDELRTLPRSFDEEKFHLFSTKLNHLTRTVWEFFEGGSNDCSIIKFHEKSEFTGETHRMWSSCKCDSFDCGTAVETSIKVILKEIEMAIIGQVGSVLFTPQTVEFQDSVSQCLHQSLSAMEGDLFYDVISADDFCQTGHVVDNDSSASDWKVKKVCSITLT